MQAYAVSNRGRLCSGALDWVHEGSVTDFGWVADSVRQGVPVSEMLCRSNEARAAEAVNQLLTEEAGNFSACVDPVGSLPFQTPDGETVVNLCRQIIEGGWAPGSAERVTALEADMLDKFSNTNFTASWTLVRGAPRLNRSGNLEAQTAACPASLPSRDSTRGPLTLPRLDASNDPAPAAEGKTPAKAPPTPLKISCLKPGTRRPPGFVADCRILLKTRQIPRQKTPDAAS